MLGKLEASYYMYNSADLNMSIIRQVKFYKKSIVMLLFKRNINNCKYINSNDYCCC
jgi:hypothetical protein